MRKLIAVALIASSVACGSGNSTEDRFVRMSPEERSGYLRRLPPGRQIDYYLLAMRRVRPRPVDLAAEIAQGGAPSARRVADRIRRTEDIKAKDDLLTILLSMRDMHVFNGCEDPSIRSAIAPPAYSVNDAPAHLRYALDVVDLCMGDVTPRQR